LQRGTIGVGLGDREGDLMETAPVQNSSIFAENVKRLTTLTDRQNEVATLVCDGLSNKIIARKLGVCEGTVKNHLYVIFQKLDVGSRADLIIRFGTSWRVA
jgi:two-component system nitrate/nitrite response regulator NarL